MKTFMSDNRDEVKRVVAEIFSKYLTLRKNKKEKKKKMMDEG